MWQWLVHCIAEPAALTNACERVGMYPCWNEGFELNASTSSIMSIQVFDRVKFSEDRVIGQGALSVNRLRRGYRFLPLLDNKFEPIPFGGVLVHVRALS